MRLTDFPTPSARSNGFTLIELMFATIIFVMVMLVVLAASVQIGRIFYKGVSIDSTNEAARTIIEDISNDVQLSRALPSSQQSLGNNSYLFCIGQHRYVFTLFQKLAQLPDATTINQSPPDWGVLQDTIPGGSCPNLTALAPCFASDETCSNSPTHQLRAQELLNPGMQVDRLDENCQTNGCQLRVHLVFYGVDNTVFNSPTYPNDTISDHAAALDDPDAYCSGSLLSTQFCGSVDLQTFVLTRF